MNEKLQKYSHKALSAVCHPVHTLADALHAVTAMEKKHLRFLLGLAFMAIGSGMAVSSGAWGLSHGAHIALDVVAYGLHGLGSAPFLAILTRLMHLE